MCFNVTIKIEVNLVSKKIEDSLYVYDISLLRQHIEKLRAKNSKGVMRCSTFGNTIFFSFQNRVLRECIVSERNKDHLEFEELL